MSNSKRKNRRVKRGNDGTEKSEWTAETTTGSWFLSGYYRKIENSDNQGDTKEIQRDVKSFSDTVKCGTGTHLTIHMEETEDTKTKTKRLVDRGRIENSEYLADVLYEFRGGKFYKRNWKNDVQNSNRYRRLTKMIQLWEKNSMRQSNVSKTTRHAELMTFQ